MGLCLLPSYSHSSPQSLLQLCAGPLLVLLAAGCKLSGFVTECRVLFASRSSSGRRQEFRDYGQKGTVEGDSLFCLWKVTSYVSAKPYLT